jgi:putative redox protein
MSAAQTRTITASVDGGGFLFEAADDAGHTLTMDMGGKAGRAGGGGFQARDLLLIGLAGCSGASFLLRLNELGYEPDRLEISVTGQLRETRPSTFAHVDVLYTVVGADVSEEHLREAADACHGTGCSISSTLEHVATIATRCELAGAPVA